jgi:hypothetical protein
MSTCPPIQWVWFPSAHTAYRPARVILRLKSAFICSVGSAWCRQVVSFQHSEIGNDRALTGWDSILCRRPHFGDREKVCGRCENHCGLCLRSWLWL